MTTRSGAKEKHAAEDSKPGSASLQNGKAGARPGRQVTFAGGPGDQRADLGRD